MSAYDSGGMLVMSIELPHDSAGEPCPTDAMYVFIIEVVESCQIGKKVRWAEYKIK